MQTIASTVPWLLCVVGFSFLSWVVAYTRARDQASHRSSALKSRLAQLRDQYEMLSRDYAVMQERLNRYESTRQRNPGVVPMPTREDIHITGLTVRELWAPTETATL